MIICPDCEIWVNHVSGPTALDKMTEEKPAHCECPKCHRDYYVSFKPKFKVMASSVTTH